MLLHPLVAGRGKAGSQTTGALLHPSAGCSRQLSTLPVLGAGWWRRAILLRADECHAGLGRAALCQQLWWASNRISSEAWTCRERSVSPFLPSVNAREDGGALQWENSLAGSPCAARPRRLLPEVQGWPRGQAKGWTRLVLTGQKCRGELSLVPQREVPELPIPGETGSL